MLVKAHSKQLQELIRPDAEPERLAGGFIFTEGPVWNAAEGALYFSDVPGDVRRRWTEARGVVEVRRPNNKGNGMTYDHTGCLLICEHSTSRVVRESPDGRSEVIASHFQGRELNSPNDIVVAHDGSIYFTDPVYGRSAQFGVAREPVLGFQGVYRIAAGGELELLADDFDQPNGLCFSPDGARLYVNDTARRHVRCFYVDGRGRLSGGAVLLGNIGEIGAPEAAPDGMKCDVEGNIYVTGPGGIWVLSPDGLHLGTIVVPEVVANLAWGDTHRRTLYVTASTSLYRLPTQVTGAYA